MSPSPSAVGALRRCAVVASTNLVPEVAQLGPRHLHRTSSRPECAAPSPGAAQLPQTPLGPLGSCRREHSSAPGMDAPHYDVAAAAALVAARGGHLRGVGGVDFKLKAVTVDAAGTLLEPTEPVPDVYLRIGEKYGVHLSKAEILSRYRRAFSAPFFNSRLRYEADGRRYWSAVAAQSTGCSHPGFLSEIHDYYSDKQAWRLTDAEAGDAFEAMRRAGLKLAVVSNFDTRLRSILHQLGCLEWFDALSVSAEVEAEKPNPVIFWHACDKLGVRPEQTVHVGDDRRNDVWGARDAGCHAWLWMDDVASFHEVAERVGVKPKLSQ